MSDGDTESKSKRKSVLEETWQKSCPDFTTPPSKREIKQYFGRNLIKKFKESFETRSWNIPHYPEISFHTVLGQLPNIRNIKIRVGNSYEDCRVHMILLQESGSGKGPGFSFTGEIAEKCGLFFKTTGKLTNSALAGSLEPDNSKSDNKQLKAGLLDPRYEDGSGVDILASNEANQVIETESQYKNREAIYHLQKAMNRYGSMDNRIDKDTGVSNRTITFNSHVSLYLTTFKPDKLFQTITQTGLLQRMIVLYNPISLEDKWIAGKKHIDMLESSSTKGSSVNMANINTALEFINQRFSDVDHLDLTDKAREKLKSSVIPNFYKPLLELDTNVMHEMKKFTTRYQVHLYKLAWHSAIMRLSKVVSVQDIAYAKRLIMPIFRKLTAMMENEYKVQNQEKLEAKGEQEDIIDVCRKLEKMVGREDMWIHKSKIVKNLSRRWDISREATRHKLNKHIQMFKKGKDRFGNRVLKLRSN